MTYSVLKITRKECEPFVIGMHYAHRWPSISHAFGLFHNGDLVGVVTFGTPASAPLRKGIAGEHYAKNVIELNRLCLANNQKNEASFLVSRALRALPTKTIVVSFADTDQGHVGYVYQACNFGYYGLSAKRTDWKIKGLEHLHGQTVADEFRGHKNRAAMMRKKYGEKFYLHPRSRKHRYIFLIGGKPWRAEVSNAIKYKQQPYPKAKKESA